MPVENGKWVPVGGQKQKTTPKYMNRFAGEGTNFRKIDQETQRAVPNPVAPGLSVDFAKKHPVINKAVFNATVEKDHSPKADPTLFDKWLESNMYSGSGAAHGLSFGAIPKASQPPKYISPDAASALVTGNEFAASFLPMGAAYGAAGKVLPQIPGRAGQLLNAGLKGGTAFGGYEGITSGVESYQQGNDAPIIALDAAKGAGEGFLWGFAGDAALHGLGRAYRVAQQVNKMEAIKNLDLSKPFTYTGPATPFRGTRSGGMLPETVLTKPTAPQLTPQQMRQGLQQEIGLTPDPVRQRIPSMHAPNPYAQAMDDLQRGIKAAQDYVQHSDILAAYPPGTSVKAAMADIKAKTGVDLPALMANVERAQQAPKLRDMVLDDIETTRLGQMAGAVPVPTKIKRGSTPKYIGAKPEVVPWTPPAPKRATRSGGVMLEEIPPPARADVQPSALPRVNAVRDLQIRSSFDEKAIDQEAVNAFVDKALNMGKDNTRLPHNMRKVTPEEGQRIKELTGVDATGFVHELNSYDLRHILNQHSDPVREAKLGQVALTEKDLKSIPDIINNYDAIIPGDLSKQEKSVFYVKRVNGTVYYLEVLSKKKSRLSTKTMYKKKAPSSATNGDPRITPDFNVQNVPGMAPSNSNIKHSYSEVNQGPVPKTMTERIEQTPTSEIPMKMPDKLPDTSSHFVSKTDVPKFNAGRFVRKFYEKSVDKFNRLKHFNKDAYQTTLNNSGRSEVVAYRILNDNMVNQKGEVIGGSFKSVLEQIPASKEKAFTEYMVARHAPSWLRKGKKVYPDNMGIPADEYGARVAEAKKLELEQTNPEFAQIAGQWDKWWADFGKAWLVDTGYLSEKTWQMWRKANPFYVRLQRQLAEVEKSKRSLGVRATGSERKIVSVIESAIEDVDYIVSKVNRNEAHQAVYRLLKENPEDMAIWGRIEGEASIADDITKADEIAQVLDDEAKDLSSVMPKHGNTVTVRVDGKIVKMKIHDKELLGALEAYTPQQRNAVVETVRAATNAMKAVTTGWNVLFAAVNHMRDIPTSYIFSKSVDNPFKFAKDMVSAYVDIVKKRAPYMEYQNMGGGFMTRHGERDMLKEAKANLLPGYFKNAPMHEKVRRAGRYGISLFERFNSVVETAPRLAEYKRWAKEGTYEARQKGLYEANDITVNFKRQGEHTKFLDAGIPYLNAAVQGLDKTARSLSKEERLRTIAKGVLTLSMPTLALWAVNYDNPNYKKLSKFVKDNNFCFPRPDGTFIKVPKPREMGVIFSTSVEKVLDAMAKGDPSEVLNLREAIFHSFMPPTRSIAAPLQDIRSNKDFIDRPIVPAYMQDLSPRYQYDERTSNPSKAIGDLFNASPMKLDYIARSYGGGFAQIGLPALSDGGSVGNVLERKFTADPLYSNDVLSDFYNEYDKLTTATRDFKEVGVKSEEYDDKRRKMFYGASSDIGEISKQIREIKRSNLSEEEKEKRIRPLREKQLAIANKAMGRSQ